MSRPSLPSRLFAHVETWRPYTACYVGLAGLAGAALADTDAPLWRLVIAWAVPTLAWIGGLYGGDYFDRDLDRTAKPHRPIPSGRISARGAWVALWVCTATGAALAAVANPRTALVATAALAAGIAYSKSLKARGLAGNLIRGAMMASVVVFGWMTVRSWPGLALLAPAVALWAQDTASNLVGTIRDVEGDRAGGYRTVPARRGVGFATRLALGCFGAAIALAGVAVLTAPGRAPAAAPGLLLAAALVGGCAYGLLAAGGDQPAVALRAHSILLTERILLAAAFIALGLGSVVGVAAAAVAIVVTVIAERALRQRHERTGTDDSPVSVTPSAVDSYVDAQIARLDARQPPLRGLVSWRRDVRIVLHDPDHALRLVTGDGRIRRAGPDEEVGLPKVTVTTAGAVFSDIFLTRRSNPRRAFLLGRLRFDGSAADMVHANGVFAEFLRDGADPAPVAASACLAEVVERAPDPAPTDAADTDHMPARVVLSDTTLRDGEQMPGVAFTTADKARIAQLLDRLGIGVIEAGFPAVSAAEAAAVREVARLGLSAVTQAIARPLPADIDAAHATGVNTVAIFVGTSDAHVLRKLRTTRAALVDTVSTAVAYAKQTGLGVVFAAEDAVRTDLPYLIEIYRAAVAAGADAVGVADTAGAAHPAAFGRVVHAVAGAVPAPIGVHCHDDLGLATANTLAGLAAGASGAQGSMLGVGERAGNAALEELALALEVAYGVATGLDLPVLAELAEVVSAAAGLPVPVNKPVLGAHAFVHESGLHVDGLLRDPATYEPYPPELIGARRRIVLGKHSGRSCVQAVLDGHGLDLSRSQLDDLVSYVKTAGHAVAPEDLIAHATAQPRQSHLATMEAGT
jgi:isopropylmalate/homocitrate/citramalate synthase/1,4-dihydroxy-2-naphthoate octaprenyltransferase